MTWWIRFCLNLPARPEDIEEMRQSLPELFDPGIEKAERSVFAWHVFPVIHEFTAEDLRLWANKADVPGRVVAASPDDCPAEECPLRKTPPATQADGELGILHFMVAGGAHKPPKDEFLDLVRHVHKGQQIREVILTDRYIYSDLSERGRPGGYDALVDYLGALKLTRDSRFDLKLTPSPRKAGRAPDALERKIKSSFPKAKVGKFRSTYRFHDRFYLARDKTGRLTGIFGPSLNGLGERSIVLMGELEPRALKRLGELV